MLIRIGRYHAVNTEHIANIKIEHDYDSALVISLMTGYMIRMKHAPHHLDGFDAYKAFDEIVAAQAG